MNTQSTEFAVFDEIVQILLNSLMPNDFSINSFARGSKIGFRIVLLIFDHSFFGVF